MAQSHCGAFYPAKAHWRRLKRIYIYLPALTASAADAHRHYRWFLAGVQGADPTWMRSFAIAAGGVLMPGGSFPLAVEGFVGVEL
jgi:hypothetical protein